MNDSTAECHIFIESAREFCAWIEGPAMNPEHGARSSVKLLSKLYQGGIILPDTELDAVFAPIQLSESQKQYMSERLGDFPFTFFYIAHPHNPEDKITKYHLTETLGLIYQAIKTGINILDNDKPDQAIHYWRTGFKSSWGKLITFILVGMHQYLEQNKLL